MDAKGAKDLQGIPVVMSSRGAKRRGIYFASIVAGREARTIDPSLSLGMTSLDAERQSFAALASFASLAVCSCR